MKLASLKHGRDGRLVIVSSDLAWFTDAFLIAPTLQAALVRARKQVRDVACESSDIHDAHGAACFCVLLLICMSLF